MTPLLALTLVLMLAPGTAQGQSVLIEARARVDATAPERIRVELDYLLDVVGRTDADAHAIPLEGLAFRPAVVESVIVAVDGEPVPFSLEVSGAGRLTGRVPLRPGHAGRTRLRVAYDVTSGFEGEDPYRIRIPLLVVGWSAAEALPGIFTAEALLASDLKVYESFPSGLTRAGEAGPVGRYTLDLPAVPALISIRATTGRVPFGGLVQILDGLVLVILAATAVLGFRYLRGTA